MKTALGLISFALEVSAQDQFLPDEDGEVEKCGGNALDFAQRCGILVSRPICALDEACYSEDDCSYTCIKKAQCPFTLYNALLPEGKLLTNCEEEASNEHSWTCDYVNQEHGHAFMPKINKVYDFDDRKMSLIGGSRMTEYEQMVEDKSYFNGFFQSSTCEGITENDIVEFNDIFNTQDCMPKCQIVENDDGTVSEKCSVVIGYDDLMFLLTEDAGSESGVLQPGNAWQLSCYRLLSRVFEGQGSVDEENDAAAPVNSETITRTKFNVDVACCDPNDESCTGECENTPVIPIGPSDDIESFFVEIEYDPQGKALDQAGFLHLQSCTFEEVNGNDEVVGVPLEIIQDGCPVKFGSATLVGDMQDRTEDTFHRESIGLLPFKINSEAEFFVLKCDLLVCPWYALNNDLCKLKDQCYLGDRYDELYKYANDQLGIVSRSSRNQSPDEELQSGKIIKRLYHPCVDVKFESDEYCVGQQGQDCWTFQLCKQRKNTDLKSSTVIASVSSLFLTLLL